MNLIQFLLKLYDEKTWIKIWNLYCIFLRSEAKTDTLLIIFEQSCQKTKKKQHKNTSDTSIHSIKFFSLTQRTEEMFMIIVPQNTDWAELAS